MHDHRPTVIEFQDLSATKISHFISCAESQRLTTQEQSGGPHDSATESLVCLRFVLLPSLTSETLTNESIGIFACATITDLNGQKLS